MIIYYTVTRFFFNKKSIVYLIILKKLSTIFNAVPRITKLDIIKLYVKSN